MKKVMINCEEATAMVVKKNSEKFSIADRLRLRMHLAMCRLCALFARQNSMIDEAAKQLDQQLTAGMPEQSKKRILEALEKQP